MQNQANDSYNAVMPYTSMQQNNSQLYNIIIYFFLGSTFNDCIINISIRILFFFSHAIFKTTIGKISL